MRQNNMILLSWGDENNEEMRVALHLLSQIEVTGCAYDHISDGTGLVSGQVSPVLLTNDARFEGEAVIRQAITCSRRAETPGNGFRGTGQQMTVRLPGSPIPVPFRHGINPFLLAAA